MLKYKIPQIVTLTRKQWVNKFYLLVGLKRYL